MCANQVLLHPNHSSFPNTRYSRLNTHYTTKILSEPKESNYPTEHDDDNLERDLPYEKPHQYNTSSSVNTIANPNIAKSNLTMATILSDLYFYLKKMREGKYNPQDLIIELEKLITYYHNF